MIEDALRRDLGVDLVERIWSQATMDERAAMDLALEAQHRTRPMPQP